MELNELVVIPPNDPPKEEATDGANHINLRISLFYDGTNNNRENVQSRQSADPTKHQPYQKAQDEKNLFRGDTSYNNDESNVSLLEAYVVQRDAGSDIHLTVYTEGAGTINLGLDHVLGGSGFGAGVTGIPAKVLKGIEDAKEKIRTPVKGIKPAKTIVDMLSIDVFGFSRGAATARYAIHLLLKDEALMIKPGPYSMGYKEITNVEVRLAGLFDTVASFKDGVLFNTGTRRLRLDAVQHARNVLQLAAADEHRKTFSLTNVSSKQGAMQYFLPGVHSDIGGGYTDGEPESQVIFKGSSQDAELDRKRLVDAGWYLESQIQKQDYFGQRFGPRSDHAIPVITHSELAVSRPKLPTAYSIIPLKIMAKFVTNDGFVLSGDYGKKISKLDEIPALQEIQGKIDIECSKATTAEHWLLKNDQLLKDIRNRYLHFSAHYSSAGMGPRIEKGRRVRRIYDG